MTMKRPPVLAIALLAAMPWPLAVAQAAPARAPAATRPNLICLISHDLGQHLGCYGVPGVRTPHLDAFAAGGLRFANSFCCAPQCSPSRSGLWTGRFPHANGVVGLAHAGFANDLHDGERHLAQILRSAGYQTHLFGSQHVSPQPKRCGFDVNHGGGRCGQVAAKVVKFLEDRNAEDGPFFLQAAFFEPHRPFPHDGVEALDPASQTVPPYLPDIPEARNDLTEMEASICALDKAVGNIFDAIDRRGLDDNTLVVFTVDHGIPFPGSKMSLYDPGIQVALLMRVPSIDTPKVFNEMISNVDVMPTLLDFLGVAVPENVQGRSFKGLITGQGYRARDVIFAEKTYHTYYDPMRCIRTGKWKLIANFECVPHQETSAFDGSNANGYEATVRALRRLQGYHKPLELYDLESDPWEQKNLAENPALATVRDELVGRLYRWMKETGDPLLDGPIPQAAYQQRMKAFVETAKEN